MIFSDARSWLLGSIALAVIMMSSVTCSPAPVAVSTSANDPSNPAAPEGLPRPSSPAASPPKSVAAATHDHGAESTDAGTTAMGGDAGTATIYVCPMHPEVTSSMPGRCPFH